MHKKNVTIEFPVELYLKLQDQFQKQKEQIHDNFENYILHMIKTGFMINKQTRNKIAISIMKDNRKYVFFKQSPYNVKCNHCGQELPPDYPRFFHSSIRLSFHIYCVDDHIKNSNSHYMNWLEKNSVASDQSRITEGL